MIRIERAQPGQAGELTAIALAAKASWGYPSRWLEIWRGALTISPAFIDANPVFVAWREDDIVAFAALLPQSATCWSLEHLWVAPSNMKMGIGRQLVSFVVEHARSKGARELAIDSEPLAEPFYRRMGAVRVGETVSLIEGEPRVRPQMLLRTGAA